jgi:hypothetical protein
MKRILKSIALTSLFILGLITTTSAQVYVRVVPRPPVYARPPCPHPGHIWVGGEWRYNGRGYEWREGYWAPPPRRYHEWIPGHWRNTRYGYRWIQGHWR